MHRLYAYALILLLICSPLARAQQDKSAIAKKIPSAAQMLNNSAQGREFWIAIPPNEFDGGYPALELEIYVTSSRDTKVTIEHPGSGFSITKPVKAYSITTLSTAPPDPSTNWAWEIRDDEKASNQGIHLTADQPISVYVLNAKDVSADGYLALPTTVWGTQYMHMSIYDFGEYKDTWPWGGGFVVVAKEDNTKIQLRLKGTDNGNPAGRTKRGRRIGDPLSVTLRRGQTYMVRGNGQTLNEFDFSGTIVTSNKPVGFLSFHQRTMIPSFPAPNNGRDHIVEMIPPMSAWGKEYVTLELQRDKNRGDFFRVFAKEKDTKFKCRYTDLKDGATYTWEGTLKEAGDFMEKENTWPPSTSIKGVAVWTANKPIFVMQYSYSAVWDDAALFDPAMVIGVPVAQYTLETVFQTPSNVDYVNNYFNILAVGDPSDPEQTKLKTIKIDEKPVWVTQPSFLVNRIQNTNIYWARVKLPPGAHHVKGETPFGGVIYGFSSFASYLWPAATALNKLDQLDTLKPVLDTVAECGDYVVTATEKRDQKPNAAGDSTQIDTGVNQIELDLDRSFNYELELLTADVDNIHVEPRREEFKFRLRVKDKSQDAFALYYVIDRAGNVAIDSVSYIAELVAMKPDSVIFGKVRLKTSKTLTAKIVNPTKRDVEVKNIWLKKNAEFKILNPTTFPIVVLAGTEVDIEFEYTPTREIKKKDEYDIDSVFAEASCGKFTLGWLQGQGVMPHIQVGNWPAGIHQVDTKYCNTNEENTLQVENTGTDVLTITEIKGVAAPFSLESITPPLPIVLQPGEKITVKTLCYNPTVTGEDALDVTFVSDADVDDPSNDNISKWTGTALDPGPKITSVDFGDKRVNTVHRADIILTNTGTFTLNVTGFRRVAADALSLKVISVKIDGTTSIDLLPPTGDLTNFKTTIPLYQNEANRIVFSVEFIPQAETSYEQLIIPTYSNSSSAVEGKAIGNGILPHIVVEGDEFECIRQGSASTEVGTVKITNTSTTASLVVQSVTLPKLPSAFELRADGPGQKMPTPADPLVIPIGETRTINAYFTADITTQSYTGVPSVGGSKNYIDDVVIVADTKPGDGVNETGNFFEPVQTQLKGCDYTEGEPGIEVSDIDFGSVLMCDTKTATFTVKNTGTRDLLVSDFLYTGNTAVYTITNEDGSSLPNPVEFTLATGAEKKFTVTFTPQNGTSPYDLSVEVVSNAPADQDDIAVLRGTSYTVPVTFAVVGSTKKLLPKEETELQFRVSGQIGEAKLNQFALVLDYEPDALRYNGRFDAPGLNGWTIVVEPDKDINGQDARGKITIRGSQNTGAPLSTEGVFLKLYMNVYLSAKDKLPLVLSAAQSDLGNRAVCVVPSTINGELLLDELCVRDFRGVKYRQPFALHQNTPNPSAQETEVEYSVAFDAPVKLALYNSVGEEIKVLVDGVREAGTYRVRITTTELPSGTYTYRIIAGPYTESRQMVISK